MLKVRNPPPEICFRNRSGKRSPRAPFFDPAKRLLVNCKHLATSDTNSEALGREETLQERLERKTRHQRHRAACLHHRNVLMETLRGIALHDQADSLDRWCDGSESPDKGPWRAARDYRRLDSCQSQWIGFKPKCCGSRAVAVPIGCNHRLCPLCNAARLEHYRGPARRMLGEMENPTFLTLTVPNVLGLKRATFTQIRGWWKAFYRENKSLLRGGLYTIEVTYNRTEQTWHPHLHILCDWKFRLSGIKRKTWNLMIATLQFSWLRITSPAARKMYRRSEIQRWIKERDSHSAGDAWFTTYWRKVDIRAVRAVNGKLDGAVFEVIKYISKENKFIDLPEAVEPFLRAVRGIRVVQTFGSFYNFKIDEPAPAEMIDYSTGEIVESDNSHLRCDCGKNIFVRIGVFSMRDVEQQQGGRWLIRPLQERQHQLRCRGTPNHEPEAA